MTPAQKNLLVWMLTMFLMAMSNLARYKAALLNGPLRRSCHICDLSRLCRATGHHASLNYAPPAARSLWMARMAHADCWLCCNLLSASSSLFFDFDEAADVGEDSETLLQGGGADDSR
jgi:hypothetical protein